MNCVVIDIKCDINIKQSLTKKMETYDIHTYGWTHRKSDLITVCNKKKSFDYFFFHKENVFQVFL